jgi:hypothetical protein
MITAIVNFGLPDGISRDEVAAMFEASAERYSKVPGLIRKYYLYSEEQRIGGGAYLWESREAADALYDAEWRATIAARFGDEPRITYFDTPVIVDNLAGSISAAAAE